VIRRDIEHARNGNGRIHASLGTRHPCRVTSGLTSRSLLPLCIGVAVSEYPALLTFVAVQFIAPGSRSALQRL